MKKIMISCLLLVFLVGCSPLKEEPRTLDIDQFNRYDEKVLKEEEKKEREEEPADKETGLFR